MGKKNTLREIDKYRKPRKKVNVVRNTEEWELYGCIKAMDLLLQYIHRDTNINSLEVEECTRNVKTESLAWFQWWLWKKIDEYEENRKGWPYRWPFNL